MTVVGCGYLGAVHASAMARIGHDVVGFDVDAEKVEQLSGGTAPFFEPGLDDLLAEALATGRLRFTTSYDEAAEHGDVHFICVGTPQKADSTAADMRYVDSAVEGLGPLLTRPCLVIGKSTVPVGVAEDIRDRLHALAPAGDAVRLAWNPEFLREGFAVKDTLAPDRVVVGVDDDRDAAEIAALYAPVLDHGMPYVVVDLATAQLVKNAANAFLATKISFINAMAELCEATGADVAALADAIGHDARIGRRFLNAGLGFGGGCLPKDLRGFMARAEELGVDQALAFLRDVDDINIRRRRRAVEIATTMLGGDVAGRRVTVLGAAFKPDSDDIRDSPALDVAAALHELGADVRVTDPKALANARRHRPGPAYVDDVLEACDQADLVVHATEWHVYRDLDPAELGAAVRGRRLLETRNTLDVDAYLAAGWDVRALGRPLVERRAARVVPAT
ncbi:MAG: nucleotide sugar dehydrogenase [Frankiales bacterium]|nr:nucleotide sugar dehydrogenase [Frankiales bacterium]